MPTTVCDFALPKNADGAGDEERRVSMELPKAQRQINLDMVLPPGTRREDRSVVSFMLNTPDADDLTFTLRIGNDRESHLVRTYVVNAGTARVFQEIVERNVLNVEHLDQNTITFEVTDGDGVLGISDVVLWFQRAI